MEKDFNHDNSKKLIIGVSILFCTVILIIGATAAYFTQSDTKDTGNIVSVDQVTLDYQDNVDNMRSDLIPINEDDLVKAYNKTGDGKCKDDMGYNVCSIYQFTVYNNSDVSQKLIIDLIPKANSFHNLKFNLKDVTNNKEIMNNVKLTYLSEGEINLLKNITLNGKSNNIYELTFYIENKSEEDQTSLDAGKRFGANIRVNSVTTGKYMLKGFGDECWTATDNNTKLTEFHGLDENGNVKEECSGYIKKDTDNLYIVNIPSTYAGSDVTTIGNNLFGAYEATEGKRFYYKNIKSITIEEGITTIEDGYWDDINEIDYTAFGYIGNSTYNQDSRQDEYNHYVTLNLPNSLTYIGDYAFSESGIKDLTLPSNLVVVGDYAFSYNDITTDATNPLVIPESVITIGESAFEQNLKLSKLVFEGNNSELTIGEWAFVSGLDYQDKDDPLIIPSNIKSIGRKAFGQNSGGENKNLIYIQYKGKNSDILNNVNDWFDSRFTTLNPQ